MYRKSPKLCTQGPRLRVLRLRPFGEQFCYTMDIGEKDPKLARCSNRCYYLRHERIEAGRKESAISFPFKLSRRNPFLQFHEVHDAINYLYARLSDSNIVYSMDDSGTVRKKGLSPADRAPRRKRINNRRV